MYDSVQTLLLQRHILSLFLNESFGREMKEDAGLTLAKAWPTTSQMLPHLSLKEFHHE